MTKPFVFYADGSPVRPGDRVIWRDREYEVLALWIDRDTNTNVSLYIPEDKTPRANSAELHPVSAR